MVTTRFAPSPSGDLHLGHWYAAHVAFQFAKQHDGKFLIRIEDLDQTRCKLSYESNLLHDLAACGMVSDEPIIKQSTRMEAYEKALSQLHELGVLYPCFCTRKEITNQHSSIIAAPHEIEPSYSRKCYHLTTEERNHLLNQQLAYSWRLDSQKVPLLVRNLSFYDMHHGKIAVQPELLGDVVLARKDIGISYHLAVVIDDAFQDITHITRGNDLLPSTHVHRILQALLNLPEPIYCHHPLIANEQGIRLAKRDHALSLRSLLHNNMNAEQLLQLAQNRIIKSI